jgi:hypothetical protein
MHILLLIKYFSKTYKLVLDKLDYATVIKIVSKERWYIVGQVFDWIMFTAAYILRANYEKKILL